MAKKKTALSTILAQLPAARAQDERERKAGGRALSARYHRRTKRVLVELSNGALFGFPVSAVPTLAAAAAHARAGVTVSPGGGALHWPMLDVDLSVPGLLLSSVGSLERARELARLAGRATSAAKSAAARENGAKGGRPRKRVLG